MEAHLKQDTDFSSAINATIQFYLNCIEYAKNNPRKSTIRANARRAAKSLPQIKPKEISKEDIILFTKTLENELLDYLSYNKTASLHIDYDPWFLFHKILEKSGIENLSTFLYRARFPIKSRVQIYHDHVELYLDGKKMPLIWFKDDYLD